MKRYNRTAIFMHWATAILIISAFGLGLTVANIQGFTPAKIKYISWHKWIGVTVLMLGCIRLLWRLRHPAPPYQIAMPAWQEKAAHMLHGALYVLILAIPVSGYLYSLAVGFPVVYLGIFPLPVIIDPDPALGEVLKSVHFWLNMTLLAAVVMHLLAVIKHVIARDGILSRMLP